MSCVDSVDKLSLSLCLSLSLSHCRSSVGAGVVTAQAFNLSMFFAAFTSLLLPVTRLVMSQLMDGGPTGWQSTRPAVSYLSPQIY